MTTKWPGRWVRTVYYFTFALTQVGLATNQLPLLMNIYPEKFEASIGGFFGPSYKVKLQSDGTLLYSDDPFDIPMPGRESNGITVSEDQWREFRKALDSANVWSWKEYYDSDILDGTQWELVIKYGDVSVRSGGSNNYPPEEEFKQFEDAVRRLLSGK